MTHANWKHGVLTCVLLACYVASGFGQNSRGDLKAKIDAIVATAYQSASIKFPCSLGGAHGPAKILSWQTVEKCLNSANDRVDWEDLARQIQKVREEGRFQAAEISATVESSLSAHALPYNKVFSVKNEEARLPLSSSLLKFLPADSLLDLPVYEDTGVRAGTFAGIFVFEKVGQISGALQRHVLFQYKDPTGNMRAAPDRLLLDSFGVPWKDAQSQPGFCLPPDRLLPKR